MDETLFNLTNLEDKRLFHNLKHFILPTEFRLALIEWLLETYEPGILQNSGLDIKSFIGKTKIEEGELQVERIEFILR